MGKPKTNAAYEPPVHQSDVAMAKRTRGKALSPEGGDQERVANNAHAGEAVATASGANQSSSFAANADLLHTNAGAEAGSGDYEIGYKKPPQKHQFKPGQSGNPRGRVRGSRNTRTIFEEESLKTVAVSENGKTQKLSKRELVLKTIINKAAKGDEKAQVKFLKLDERFSAEDGKSGGSAGSTSMPLATLAELSVADQIILERYREMSTAVTQVTDRDAAPSSDIPIDGNQ